MKNKITKTAPVKQVKAKQTPLSIEKASQAVLEKLNSLSALPKLQAEIEWCLGSYQCDKNPVGLINAIAKAHTFFKSESAKKTKGVTAKFVSDIEKMLKNN